MEDRIVTEVDATLIITVEIDWFVVLKFRALYSNSHDDLEVLDYFLNFQEIGLLIRKKM